MYVSLFGQFQIQSDGISLNRNDIHSAQMEKLLVYLLIYRDRNVSRQELMEVLWEDGVNHPQGALKNLIYRLRNLLKKIGDMCYIITNQGNYCWNREIPVAIDAELFEKKAKKAMEIRGSRKDKILLCEEALSYCHGNYLPEFSMETWQIPLSTYYHSLYLTITKELIRLYYQEQDYKKMSPLLREALARDNLDEELHYWMIRNLMAQNKWNLAYAHYKDAAGMLHKGLGIRKSDLLDQIREELIARKQDTESSVEDIYEDMAEKEEASGVFFCEYNVFREIYRLEARRMDRMGMAVYMLLLTLHFSEDVDQSKIRVNFRQTAMERLKSILENSLQVGDVVSCYSENQYIILLPTCSCEDVERICERIQKRFEKKSPDKKAVLIYELKEIEPNNLILGKPVERRGRKAKGLLSIRQ